MSADLTARLAALLCGASEHGELIVAPESDDPRNRIAACYQCQRHAAVLAEAGVGFVAEARGTLLREAYSGMGMVPKELLAKVERERDEALMLVRQGAAGSLCPDLRVHGGRVQRIVAEAERAEAALEKVRALADAWERDAAAACDGADHSGCPDCGGKVYAADLRAALGGTP